MLGLSAMAAAVAGGGALTSCSAGASEASGTATATARGWFENRGSRYYIAHRGSGDVLPEHSMVAYQAAVDWGAECMEVSIGMTADGVLICMHDSTYDRTTTLTGAVKDQPSSVLEDARIWQPQLGEYWTENAPPIPLFEDVLLAFGGKVVLAVEAKDHRAYEPIMAMIGKYELEESVIVKAYYSSATWRKAKSVGLPVFCYFGVATEVTVESIAAIGAELDPELDCLVIPGFAADGTYISDEVVVAAVATMVPVWVHPLHRRSEVSHFFELGAQGAICSSFGYAVGAVAPLTGDDWAQQAIEPGEMSRAPASITYSPKFTANGNLVLDAKGLQHFITLGQLGSVPSTGDQLVVEVEAGWLELPGELTDNLTIAFGRVDDSYYEHRQGAGSGYHAILRANGELGLFRHDDGTAEGTKLGTSVMTAAMVVGQSAKLRLELAGDRITFSRLDSVGAVNVVDDGRTRVTCTSDGARQTAWLPFVGWH